MSSFIFISGATGGLGKAFAVECASRGWDVFLTDLDTSRLEILTNSLRQTYDIRALSEACDLTDHNERTALFDKVIRLGVRFQMLINVAGVDYEGAFRERTRDEIRTIVRLNIESTLDVTHTLLACADPVQPLRIINVSSLAAFYPMPIKATYAASKRFLLDFSLALRDELHGRGATVTVLCPGGMPTRADTIEAIEAQGFWGQLTTMDIGLVAARTIDYALLGRAVYIPGVVNQLLQLGGRLVPAISLAGLIGKRWRTAHDQRHNLQDQSSDGCPEIKPASPKLPIRAGMVGHSPNQA
jgi:short-subunit dehydrogenase